MTWLSNKNILVTGGARRVGKLFTLALATAGANVIIHHSNSPIAAEKTAAEVQALGMKASICQADFSQPSQVHAMMSTIQKELTVHGLVNNAAIFDPLSFSKTTLDDWNKHLNINLTAPFLLSQWFAHQLPVEESGRIINILDWRALRPANDHFPYTISKAALAAFTRSLAIELAPRITVNGIALGAILPPADGAFSDKILERVPVKRWVDLDEVGQTLIMLLNGPAYITGEIVHLDGGRHLI